MRINLWRSFILRTPKRAGLSGGAAGWIVHVVLRGGGGGGTSAGVLGYEVGGGGMLFVYGQHQRRPTNRKPMISPAPPAYNTYLNPIHIHIRVRIPTSQPRVDRYARTTLLPL